MRSALAAAAVAAFAVLTLARARAEPPPQMEPRELDPVIAALKKEPKLKTQLASVRFYAEVFGGKSLEAPVGSPLTTLGPWGDDGALLSSEAAIASRSCGPLPAAERKAAVALLGEYAAALSPSLRGYALLEQGKAADAEALFAKLIDDALPAGACPGEHPMYSHRRIALMTMARGCLERAAPGKDRSAYEKRIERAKSCAANNRAVG